MERERLIIAEERFALTIDRLCQELIERYDTFRDTCVVGIQQRGARLSQRLVDRLRELQPDVTFLHGKLDITFYRDDFRLRDKPLRANTTEMDFLVEDRRVILIDDVLYTGRTVQAALTALNHYGRPRQVELLVLVDRRFNRTLPIQADYVGITVDAVDKAYVQVNWKDRDGHDEVLLFPDKSELQ
jgi:pyrimidine operon attenuation protein/uracil phosphoribosyltransferase